MANLIEDIGIIGASAAASSETFRVSKDADTGKTRKLYIESYGCQMNYADSEIVASILKKEGYDTTSDLRQADVIFLNTCSIRDKAEQTVRNRLTHFTAMKRNNPGLLIGVLGCMAERLKSKLVEEEKIVDLVAGPDAYRDLPRLIAQVDDGGKAVNTFLSREETYADISPVRLNSNGITAFISIMRGCDNMCTFCVVPFTRGRERSRDPKTVVAEATDLFNRGYREVTLLGQNVDSYKWSESENNKARLEKKGVAKLVNFAGLLEMVAQIHPDLRIRFSTSHPKDITDDVLHTMAKHENICKYIHLPFQSGSTRILGMMNRGYTREWYLQKISRIKDILGDDCGISSDMISGFCSETEADHAETLSLMDTVKFDYAYMFCYSERPGTLAEKKFADDVPPEVKKRRLAEVIERQNAHSLLRNKADIGRVFKVLVEGRSKKSEAYLQGRNTANKVVVFPKEGYGKGQYVQVRIEDCTGGTLIGKVAE
ncbi:MAG TPA: tRNA (N6-isopentenyl adenosine(37)-C2)-methylthiotransferase MiaB [Chryseosolibacter sp.]